MNAIEFVKHHGINETQRIVSTYPNHTHVTDDARMFINSEVYKKSVPHFADSIDAMVKIADLKQIVDAWELVESYSGLSMAKRQYSCFANACESVGVNQSPRVLALGRAINLVEQCQ